MVEDGITAANSVTELLCRDHRRLGSILADAKRWLLAGNLPRASARFAEFRDGLEHHIAAEEEVLFLAFDHNGKEERIPYPATDQAARDADALEALVRRIEAFGGSRVASGGSLGAKELTRLRVRE